jgi:hypothetical protein
MTDEQEFKQQMQTLAEGKQQTPVQAEPTDPLTKIRNSFEELKSANDAYEREQLRAEEIRAKQQMGGRAFAGQPSEKTPEQIADEEAKELMRRYR